MQKTLNKFTKNSGNKIPTIKGTMILSEKNDERNLNILEALLQDDFKIDFLGKGNDNYESMKNFISLAA